MCTLASACESISLENNQPQATILYAWSEKGVNTGYQGSLGQRIQCKKQRFHHGGNKSLENHLNATEEPWEGNVILLFGATMLWAAKMLSSSAESQSSHKNINLLWMGCIDKGLSVSPLAILQIKETFEAN